MMSHCTTMIVVEGRRRPKGVSNGEHIVLNKYWPVLTTRSNLRSPPVEQTQQRQENGNDRFGRPSRMPVCS